MSRGGGSMRAAMLLAAQATRLPRYLRFVEECRNVREAQEATLRRLVERLGRTRVARRLGASGVTGLDDLRRRVPLTEYDDYRDDIEAARRGEPDVMIAGRPEFFGMTSGTTTAYKYIPINAAYRVDFQTPVHVFLYAIGRDHPAAFHGKILYFVGSADLGVSPAGIPEGFMSGYNFKHAPRAVRGIYAAPYEAFAIADPDARTYAVALTALHHEVSAVVGVTTQPLFTLGEALRRHGDALLRDLSLGTITPPGSLTASERAALAPFVRRAPERARALSQRAASAGALTPAAAWPSLALLSCWFHGSAGAFDGELSGLYGELPRRSAIYSATEGWINVPMADGTSSGVVSLGANVLEFIPLDARGELGGDPVFADGVKEGGRYALVLTSGAGLWRYMLRDEVECTGFYRRAPLIRFLQKFGSTMSLGHDLTSEHHVRQAVDALRSKGVAIPRYCFGPYPGMPSRYAFFVPPIAATSAVELAERLEEELGRANPLYLGARREGALSRVEVVYRDASVFREVERVSALRAGAQAKPVEFTKKPEIVASFLGEPEQGEARDGA